MIKSTLKMQFAPYAASAFMTLSCAAAKPVLSPAMAVAPVTSRISFVGQDDFEEKVLLAKRPVMLMLTAARCGYCKAMEPAVESLAQEAAPLFDIVKMDADKNAGLTRALSVTEIPTVMMFSAGAVYAAHVQSMPKQELYDWAAAAYVKTQAPRKSIPVTSANFDDEVLRASGYVLLEVGAAWCGPCKSMAPALEDVARHRMKVLKADVDESPEIRDRYGIQGLPTLMIFKDGVEVTRRRGSISAEELNDWLEQSTNVEAMRKRPIPLPDFLKPR